MPHPRPVCAAIALLTILASSGCVQRRLTVTSEPAGAIVYLNNAEAGRTPFTTEIRWYGNHDVEVRKEGYETLTTTANVKAPWWQYPPVDFFAELMPWRPTDRQALNFTLAARPDAAVDAAALVERGLQLKRDLPTTQASR